MDRDKEKTILADKVTNFLHAGMFSRAFNKPEIIPQEQAERVIAQRQVFLDRYRETLVELYCKHFTTAQLQALLDFHDSEMGRSIKEAQKKLYRELNIIQEQRTEQLNRKKPEPGGAVIRTIVKKSDFFNPDDDM